MGHILGYSIWAPEAEVLGGECLEQTREMSWGCGGGRSVSAEGGTLERPWGEARAALALTGSWNRRALGLPLAELSWLWVLGVGAVLSGNRVAV